MGFRTVNKNYEVVVGGGGFSGICAAITAARLGKTVALINNRSYIGGNASVEGFICVNGATGAEEFNFFAREPGIVDEILLENLHRNPEGNRWIWDALLIDFIKAEKNIDLYLNTAVCDVTAERGVIHSVTAVNAHEECEYRFCGKTFIDDTGDGSLAALCGCEFRMGREAKHEFNEMIAPEVADHWVLPSTMVFTGKDMGHPVKYIAPSFALDINTTKLLQNREIPKENFARNYWYYELDGDLDQTKDYAIIQDDHRAFIYGVWDHIKNSGRFDADNYDLEYVSAMPAKRESRRIVGDHVLSEPEVVYQKEFDDPVAYGGWSIDLHALEGIYSDDIQNRHYILNGIFQIPYRSCYAKDVDNLFICGRSLSVTHVAHGATRLIATLGMIGEAVAVAASLCIDKQTNARGIYRNHLEEYKQKLLSIGHTVFGTKYTNENDLARAAKISASSSFTFQMREPTDYMPLTDNLAIVLPTGSNGFGLDVKIKAKTEACVKWHVYLPNNEFSYAPNNLIDSGEIKLEEGKRIIHLEPNVPTERYVFIELEANENVLIGRINEKHPGIICMVKRKNLSPYSWSARDRVVKEHNWRRTPYSYVFSCSNTHLYSPENVTNGLLNPYNGTNMWRSAEGAEGEYLDVDLVEKKKIHRIEITFNADTDKRLKNSACVDYTVIPQIIADLDVMAYNGESGKIAARLRDNYQRKVSIELNGVECDKLRLLIKRTNGDSTAQITAVSVF